MINRFWSFINQSFVKKSYRIENFSPQLGRNVLIDILLPPRFRYSKSYPLIIFNDGQDFPALNIQKTLADLYNEKLIEECIIIGVHCNDQRLYEYGTLDDIHYAGYGNKAHQYNSFITKELLPWIFSKYKVKKNQMTIAGFSLGALSALDIAWHNNPLFQKVGVFSASLWWRSQPFDQNNPDANRIMIETLQKSEKKSGLQFWFEVGTKDEEDDRNNNGVIDVIDDTKDAIEILLSKGYSLNDIRYTEIEDGEHNPQTWGYAMPEFLLWAIGK